MRFLLCSVVLIVCPLVYSAPIPQKPSKPTPSVTVQFDGKYKLIWAHSEWVMHFDSKSGYCHDHLPDGSSPWYGNYQWDDKTRTLTVKEQTGDPVRFLNWTVILGKDLKGGAKVSETGGTIEVAFSKSE